MKPLLESNNYTYGILFGIGPELSILFINTSKVTRVNLAPGRSGDHKLTS